MTNEAIVKSRSPVRRIIAICVHCLEHRQLTKHHVLPRAWFGGKGPILLLCHNCHADIGLAYAEAEMKHGGKLPPALYARIAVDFIKNGHNSTIGF